MPESAPAPQDPPVGGKSSPDMAGPGSVKTCPACKIEKPLTEYFRSKRLPQGASSYCKLCDTKRKKDGHIQTRPSRFVDGGCVCAKCKQTLPLSAFYVTASSGPSSYCRKCSAAAALAYHNSHPKDHAKLARKYRKSNPEVVDAAWKRFHEKRPELKFLQGARVRAKRKGLAFDLYDHASEIAERLAKMRCELTGIPLVSSWGSGSSRFNTPSIDRIDPAKGYTYDNIRIVCWAINTALGNWGEDVLWGVFQAWANKKNESNPEGK